MVEVTTIPQGHLNKGKCDPCLCLTEDMKKAIKANSEKADVSPILGEDGTTVVGFVIDGVEFLLPVPTPPVTYTLTQAGDVLTFSGSDGSTQTVTIVHPDDEDTVLGDPSPDSATGIVTWPVLNADGTPTGDTRTGDFSSFLSSPHPAIAASGDATAIYDAVADTWTIGFVDTDTFATVSGSTVTDASGNSVTVPAGSTYNPATNEITTSDGQVVALMVDTDTDTFATQNANGDLVLADGTIVPLVVDTDTDRVNQLTINADGSVTSQIVDIDGNPVGSPVVIPAPPVDTITPYSQGRANTLAEVNAGAGTDVDFGSTEFLTANRAVEAAASGVRNEDGSLGNFQLAVPDTTTAINNNGSHFGTLYTNGQVFEIPNGTYDGQIVNLFFRRAGGQSAFAEAIVRTVGNWFGIARNKDHEVVSGGSWTDFIIRDDEAYTLRWYTAAGRWEVISTNLKKFHGSAWWEDSHNGRVSIVGSINNIQAATTNSIVLPVVLTVTGYTLQLSLSSTQASGWSGLATGNMWSSPASRTTTGFDVENTFSLASTATAGRYDLRFGRLDYAALGGIASY